jgi:hypothetical protein
MWKSIGWYMLVAMGGFLVGTILCGLVFVAIGAAVSDAAADDTVVTREARLGEQDRSLSYKSPGTVDRIVIIYDDTVGVDGGTSMDCSTWNRKLLAKVEMIARSIARDPVNGHFYEGALETIHSLWCNDGS